jgi:uncharacterized protein (DUF1015 family)
MARANLERMRAHGVLLRDAQPGYSIYRLTWGAHGQTGLVAAASIAAYDAERIKRHELTRPVKEDDRVRQIDALNAQTGPVLLTFRAQATIDRLLSDLTHGRPDTDVVAPDGVRHQLWRIAEPAQVAALTRAFEPIESLYIADGHHRCAAASRVAAMRRATDPSAPATRVAEGFLAVMFPHDQMRILDYNRVIRDLNGHSPEAFLRRLAVCFAIEGAPGPVQAERPGEFGMYLAGHWYRLSLDAERIPFDDPVGRLDVSLLQNNLICPVLGIQDPRRDERIDFIGGIRGLQALAERVDAGEMAVAFSLFPTSMDDLMAVADAGEVMPPKSTWFEPKLADGLVSLVLDEVPDDPVL